jgi:hypothetical protein
VRIIFTYIYIEFDKIILSKLFYKIVLNIRIVSAYKFNIYASLIQYMGIDLLSNSG